MLRILATCVLAWSFLLGVVHAEGPAFIGTCHEIAWNANTEPDLAGYRLYDNGTTLSTVGLVATVPCAPLNFGVGQHAIQLTAYDTSGNVLINPNGGGNEGIGTTNPGAT